MSTRMERRAAAPPPTRATISMSVGIGCRIANAVGFMGVLGVAARQAAQTVSDPEEQGKQGNLYRLRCPQPLSRLPPAKFSWDGACRRFDTEDTTRRVGPRGGCQLCGRGACTSW